MTPTIKAGESNVSILIDFVGYIDQLKSVIRKNALHDRSRAENTAEHSWHLAMACWSIARSLEIDVSEEKLLKLALTIIPKFIK